MPAAAARCGEKREEQTQGTEAGGAARGLDGYLRGFYTAGLSTVGLGRSSRGNSDALRRPNEPGRIAASENFSRMEITNECVSTKEDTTSSKK